VIKWLLTVTLAVVVLGLFSPWLRRLALRKLGHRGIPGDFDVERKGTRFNFPIGSTIILSLLASLVFWLLW
jgi:hypothetical protein